MTLGLRGKTGALVDSSFSYPPVRTAEPPVRTAHLAVRTGTFGCLACTYGNSVV